MLTTDMVRVRRRGEELVLAELKPAQRRRMLRVAERYVACVAEHRGRRRGELDAALDRVEHAQTDYKLVKGLRKLLLDRCTFEVLDAVDPMEVRRTLFTRAAAVRRSLRDGDSFEVEPVVRAAAAELQMSPDELQAALYADLKQNHLLADFDAITARQLVDAYEMGQRQAVLLRAVSVVVELRCADPASYRLFFRRLKFRRLLYTLERIADGGYRVEIDGPFSLFQAVTKYGLQLAMLLPALEQCGGAWKLEAEIRWSKRKPPSRFLLEGKGAAQRAADVRLPDEVARLQGSFARRKTAWEVAVADELLDLPGVGLCVPDLVFTHRDSKQRVFLEVMGYWSRAAVWRRVDLVRAGLSQPIIFAVSSRLRVSEDVLDDDLPGQLYVYKGALSARVVAERLDALRGCRAAAPGVSCPPRQIV